MTTTYKVSCPNCRQSLNLDKQRLGLKVRCPRCYDLYVASLQGDDTFTGDPEQATTDASHAAVGGTAPEIPAINLPKPDGDIRIGRFHVQSKLGHGGFGVVYQAHDPHLDRMVAIKVPTLRSDDKRRQRRFVTEARSAARLHHPNIVTVYENGRTQNGQLYLATEFVRGRTLKDVIRKEDRTLSEKVAWVRELADALAYAHSEGVVHRDIKPDNILIDDLHQRPRIADFGLAKVLKDSLSNPEAPQETQDGILGTPAFMAPEQARGTLSEVGPHSDQYSLGAVLYQCLTGQAPFSGSLYVIVAAVAGSEEPAPILKLAPETPVDLVAICEKAMSKSADNRYADVAAFGEDLSRWLRDEPVQARPASNLVKVARWCRRNPSVAGLSGTLAAVLITATVVLSFALAETNAQRRSAEASSRDAIAAKEEAVREKEKAVAAKADAEAAEQKQIEATQEAVKAKEEADDAKLAAEDAARREKKAKEHAEQQLAEIKRQTKRAVVAESDRDMQKQANKGLELAVELKEANSSYTQGISLIDKSPGRGLLWLAAALAKVEGLDTPDEAARSFEEMLRSRIAMELPRLPVMQQNISIDVTSADPRHVAFSSDGKRLAIVNGSTLTVCSTYDGEQLYTARLMSQSTIDYFTPDGMGDPFCNGLCFTGNNDTVILCRGNKIKRDKNAPFRVVLNSPPWQIADSRIEVHFFPPNAKSRSYSITPDPSGMTIWSAPSVDHNGIVVVGTHFTPDANWSNRVYELRNDRIRPLSPDLDLIHSVVAAQRHLGRNQLRLATGTTIRTIGRTANDLHITQCQALIQSMTISQNEQYMATIQENGEVLLHTEGLTDPHRLPHEQQKVTQVAFRSDSRLLATGCMDSHVRLWDVDSGQQKHLSLQHPDSVTAVGFVGENVCTLCLDRKIRHWRLPTATPSVAMNAESPVTAEFSPGGERILLIDNPRMGKVLLQFDCVTGNLLAENPGFRSNLTTAHYVGAGDQVIACEGASTHLLDANTLQPIQQPIRLPGYTDPKDDIVGVASSRDATRLMMLQKSGQAHLYVKTSTNPFRKITMHGGRCVAITADGRRAAVGMTTGEVLLVDTDTGKIIFETQPTQTPVTAACFSPDGDRLAIAAQPAGILLLNTTDGTRTGSFSAAQDQRIDTIAFQKDGTNLVSVSPAGMRIWNIESGVMLLERQQVNNGVVMAINPAGTFLVSGTQIEPVVARAEGSAAELTRMLEQSVGMRLTGDGTIDWLKTETE